MASKYTAEVVVSGRTIAAMAFLLVLAGPGTALAGQQASPSTLSPESLRLWLQRQPAEIGIASSDSARKLGVFTLVPPITAGEVIRVRVPIGELVSRAAHGISKARRNRAENAARAEVARSLAEFLSKPRR